MPENPSEQFIWVSRWREFQHYKPERDKAPPWIKQYTRQHNDDDYLELSIVQRALLHDVRIAFAQTRGRLTRDTRQLSYRFRYRVTTATLDALNHAGFIEFLSRESLDSRLDSLYGDSRAEVEVEVEKTLDVDAYLDTPSSGGNSETPSRPDQNDVAESDKALLAEMMAKAQPREMEGGE